MVAPIAIAFGFAFLAMFLWLREISIFGVPLKAPSDSEGWTKVLGFAFGLPAGLLALVTYARGVREQRRANLWKRNEHLVARFDRLEASEKCGAAMRMLDYNATYVELSGLGRQQVNDLLVMSALAPHQQRGSYTIVEQAIREAFDAFFSELDRLGHMVGSGLMQSDDLSPYAGYWLKLFDPAERGRPEPYGAILRRYVRVFHFDGLAYLLQVHNPPLLAAGDSQQGEEDDKRISDFDKTWISPDDIGWKDRLKGD